MTIPCFPLLAWGPGMHLELGLRFLEAGALGGGFVELLRNYRNVFLYGSVVADVVVGKELVTYEEHSHNWTVAARLGELADSDREQVFALGYWTHIAADTVAHNLYVPRQIFRTASSRKFGHGYWELRADGTVDEKYWDLLDEVTSEGYDREHEMLREAIRVSPLPIPLSRRILELILYTSGHRGWRAMVAWLDEFSRYDLSSEELEPYRKLCIRRMADSLGPEEQRQKILRMDPTGGKLDRTMLWARNEIETRIARGELPDDFRDRFEQSLFPELFEASDS